MDNKKQSKTLNIRWIKQLFSKPIYLLVMVLVFVILFNPAKDFINQQIKVQSLRSFYNQLSSAYDQKQWSDYYDLLPQSTKRFVNRDQFVSYMNSKSNSVFSNKTTINSVEINGNIGKINRTRITCLSSDCSGDNKKIDTAEITYLYENGKWKIPEVEPTEKALSLAYFMYANSGTKTDQQNAINKWSNYGVATADYSVHNFALFLDNDSAEMAIAENWVETYKANQNKQVIIQRQIPMPEFNPPRLQIKTPQQTNCLPNGIGGFNCTTY